MGDAMHHGGTFIGDECKVMYEAQLRDAHDQLLHSLRGHVK